MASIPSPAKTWRSIQIPRPLQKLFDRFPLVTYEANKLPERSQHLTSSDLPTLHVFCTEEDARLGLPSYNPGCLKWQTLLRLAKVQFRILPSTNHASPTGSLPFLLPPRTSPTSSPPPIPADKLSAYALQHGTASKPPPSEEPAAASSSLRSQAYLSLITLHLRNAWLHALYLDPAHTALLHTLYIAPASSSRAVQTTILYQLRHAAAEQIVASGSVGSVGGWVGEVTGDAIDEEVVYASAREALEALASALRESGTGWFFGAGEPTDFDAALFSYTHLMMEYMGPEGGLGEMVRSAGGGELAGHRQRMLEAAWPGWDGKR